jgi:predicted ester cyclase
MVGCQDKEAMAELEEFRAQAKVEEQNKEVIRRLLTEIDKGNAEIIKELFAPNVAYYFPSNSPKPMSQEESYEFMKMFFEAFPKWHHKIEELIAVDDKVILRAVDSSTHEGEFMGIPATGNRVEFGAMLIYRLQNGKVVEVREEGDMVSFYQQLGMELKPKEGEK